MQAVAPSRNTGREILPQFGGTAACASASNSGVTPSTAGRRSAAQRRWRLRKPSRAAVADIGCPSQHSYRAKACRGVRIAEARSVACGKSVRVTGMSAKPRACRTSPSGRPSSAESSRRSSFPRWRHASSPHWSTRQPSRGRGLSHAFLWGDLTVCPKGAGTAPCPVFDDIVVCWGYGTGSQTDPPPGEFRAVSAGSTNTCGVRIDDSVECWGGGGAAYPSPAGRFRMISVGSSSDFICGVRIDGSAICWEWSGMTLPTSGYRTVSVGGSHVCGIVADDSVVCWGSDVSEQATPPPGEFRAVSAGFWHTCGVQVNDSVTCRGDDTFGQAKVPQ